VKIGSLCSGYGGLDMAMEAYYNAETVWMCDIDKYSSIVIKERWGLPNLGDLKTVDWLAVEPIDILTAGYPCQPFSTAGQRKGLEDERHIWPYIKEIIGTLQPKRVILENVRGHLTLGFKEVLKDLTEIGYDARWAIVRASDVGAPHRRERLFVLAQPSNSNGEGLQRAWNETNDTSNGSTTNANDSRGFGNSQESQGRLDSRTPSDSDGDEQQRNWKTPQLGSRYNTRDQMRLQSPPNPLDINNKLNAKFVEYMMGLPVGWVTDLDISRSQQLKLLGNGVVPQQAYYAIEKLERL
jgi:DNA (cytosine-5)-methyltransferase 1